MENKLTTNKMLETAISNASKEEKEFIGHAFEALDKNDMEKLQGAGDVEGETTPLTVVTTSSAACGAGISAVSGIVVSKIIKH